MYGYMVVQVLVNNWGFTELLKTKKQTDLETDEYIVSVI